MSDDAPKYISCTAKIIQSMLFGWDELWGEPMLSVIATEPESFYPRRVPVELAKILERHDPDGQLFKIFYYPQRAEVWHMKHWQLSASYKMLRTLESAERLAKHNAAKDVARSEFERLQRTKSIVLKHYPILNPELSGTSPRAFIEFCRSIHMTPKDHEFFRHFPALLECLEVPSVEDVDSSSSSSSNPSTNL